jgi:hypothetical protein
MAGLNRSNADAVAASAAVLREDEILGIINGKAIVLVDNCTTTMK